MSDRSGGSWSFGRRTALELMGGVALGGVAAGTAAAGGRTRTERTCYVKQGDRAYEIEPLTGDVPIERLYDYRLPDEYEGVGVTSSEGPHYRSVGTQDLQVESTTLTFLYDGPDGLSLVVLHGRPGGEGGSVSWTIERVPRGAEWAVKDDLYVDADTGDRAANNYDRWETDGDSHRVDWTWGSHGTDGGALSGLGETFSLTVRPRFNEDAELYGEHYSGRVDDWQFLSGSLDSPDRRSLELDEPVIVVCESMAQRTSRKQTRGDDHNEDWEDDQDRDGGLRHGRHREERRLPDTAESAPDPGSGSVGRPRNPGPVTDQVQSGDSNAQIRRQNRFQTRVRKLLNEVAGEDD